MAGIALRVRIEAGGDGERHAASRGFMTARAVCSRPDVLLMVERDAKTVESRKALERRIGIAEVVDVTDRAHRDVGRGELGQVAIDAGFVSGESGLRRSAVALVAGVAVRRITEIGVRARTRVRKL